MIIAIDVDGVCAEFHPAFNKLAGVVLQREFQVPDYGNSWHIEEHLSLTAEEADKVWAVVSAPDWAKSLADVEFSRAVIRRLAERHRVVFVTSPLKTSPTWSFDRVHWLKERYGDVVQDYISTSSKFLIDADILIEDHTGHINDWLQHKQDRGNQNAFAILYARPYNVSGIAKAFEDRVKRLDDWRAIEAFIYNWLGG